MELENKMNEKKLSELLKDQQNSIKAFNKSGAVIITIVIYILIQHLNKIDL